MSARRRSLLLAAQGDVDGAAAAIHAAVALHEGLDMPFERGRTLLALGQVMRRRKERRAARSRRRSLQQFDDLLAGVGALRHEVMLSSAGGP